MSRVFYYNQTQFTFVLYLTYWKGNTNCETLDNNCNSKIQKILVVELLVQRAFLLFMPTVYNCVGKQLFFFIGWQTWMFSKYLNRAKFAKMTNQYDDHDWNYAWPSASMYYCHVQSYLQSITNILHEPLQFAYRANRSEDNAANMWPKYIL